MNETTTTKVSWRPTKLSSILGRPFYTGHTIRQCHYVLIQNHYIRLKIVGIMVFKATFNNISVISWRSVLGVWCGLCKMGDLILMTALSVVKRLWLSWSRRPSYLKFLRVSFYRNCIKWLVIYKTCIPLLQVRNEKHRPISFFKRIAIVFSISQFWIAIAF
jgi:hypothetical protein